MVGYEEALSLVLSSARPGPTTERPLEDALGWTLAENVVSPFNVPRFSNSAVDGYAVHSDDLDSPDPLTVTGTQAAGTTVPGLQVTPGNTVNVMTGAPLPFGTSAVVMLEDVVVSGTQIVLKSAAESGQHVRGAGEELREGALAVARGTRVTPPVLGALASVGRDTVAVVRPAKAAVLATGNELVAPGGQLLDGQVFESNAPALAGLMRQYGAEATTACVQDTLEATETQLETALDDSDFVLTIGGASVGQFDFVKTALERLGFTFVVNRVSIKPGKPFALAVKDEQCVFCLPGNPMSALTTAVLFVGPWLDGWYGRPTRPSHEGLLVHSEAPDPLRDHFMPSQFSFRDGRLEVDTRPTVGSHAVTGLNATSCLARLRPGTDAHKAGTPVDVLFLPWSQL